MRHLLGIVGTRLTSLGANPDPWVQASFLKPFMSLSYKRYLIPLLPSQMWSHPWPWVALLGIAPSGLLLSDHKVHHIPLPMRCAKTCIICNWKSYKAAWHFFVHEKLKSKLDWMKKKLPRLKSASLVDKTIIWRTFPWIQWELNFFCNNGRAVFLLGVINTWSLTDLLH